MTLPTLRRLLGGGAALVCVLVASLYVRGRWPTWRSAHAASLEEQVIRAARARLHAYEEQQRRYTDFATLPPASVSHGPDPYALARLDGQHWVGVLRGASELVVLDRELREIASAPAPESASCLVVREDGEILVGGEGSPRIWGYRFERGALTMQASLQVVSALGVRALALGPENTLYALDVRGGNLFTLRPGEEWAVRGVQRVGHGPIALLTVGRSLLVNVLLDHALVVYGLDEHGDIAGERARIVHDGPIWGFDALARGPELLIVAGGVEDRPLERRDGSFGYIDSFVFSYLLRSSGSVERLREDNVSALGIVTPKALSLSLSPEQRAQVFVSGYASARAATLRYGTLGSEVPDIALEDFVPGAAQAAALGDGTLAFGDPLLDAWLLREAAGGDPPRLRRVAVRERAAPLGSSEARLGEALFFTTLMAPHNSSEGRASRFTCETCHFEGDIDGRVHHTGRGDVRVVTKPLRGLFNNRPHFSRAFDADLTTVAFNEFRVAGKGSGTDPWFSLRRSDYPWLAELDVSQEELAPEALRRALITFLMGFSHVPNPARAARSGYSGEEKAGAALFAQSCAGCHAARLSTDQPSSAVPLEGWEPLLFSAQAPLVWASPEYRKVGVTPYVCELGTRTPSLRRVYKKWPYFTNGSASTLESVLESARFDGSRFFHAGAPSEPTLRGFEPYEVHELAAFLALL